MIGLSALPCALLLGVGLQGSAPVNKGSTQNIPDFNDKYDNSLANPVYQETAWIQQKLEPKDVSFQDRYQAVLNQFQGNRHNVKLIQSYRAKFKAKPSSLTATEQATAVLGFLGSPFGELASYAHTQPTLQFGQREYWDLATHWPKSPSPTQYRLRTYLYAVIGGNIDFRLQAVEHYLQAYPGDLDLQRMRMMIRVQMNPYWKKLSAEESSKFQIQSAALWKQKPLMNYLYSHYTITCAAADIGRNKKLCLEASELGRMVLEKCKANPYDAKNILPISQALEKRKKLLTEGFYK